MNSTEPSESPYGFVADSSATTTAHLQWSPLSGDKQNGELAGYEVMCSSENSHAVTVQVSGTSITLADLQASNIYTCLLCAFTSVGCGPTATAYFSTYRDCKLSVYNYKSCSRGNLFLCSASGPTKGCYDNKRVCYVCCPRVGTSL